MRTPLQLGLSPCPNDTFIFHALLHGLVRFDHEDRVEIRPFFADVEELNSRALAGELPVTKISAGVVPHILDKYVLLASGGALGWGCGPVVIAEKADVDVKKAVTAIPGRYTTANLLLDLHGGFLGARREMLFSDIMPAVKSGEAGLGVIIHEGRFTWQKHGLVKILDLGQWWEATRNMPLPLGVIAVRRDVDMAIAHALETAIAASIRHGRANPAASRDFIRKHAQELDDDIIDAHIKTFVTDFSLDLGAEGRKAVNCLLSAGAENGFPRSESVFLEN